MIEKPKPDDRDDFQEQKKKKTQPETAPCDPPDGNTVPSDI